MAEAQEFVEGQKSQTTGKNVKTRYVQPKNLTAR